MAAAVPPTTLRLGIVSILSRVDRQRATGGARLRNSALVPYCAGNW